MLDFIFINCFYKYGITKHMGQRMESMGMKVGRMGMKVGRTERMESMGRTVERMVLEQLVLQN
jgi:hypothetical protein